MKSMNLPLCIVLCYASLLVPVGLFAKEHKGGDEKNTKLKTEYFKKGTLHLVNSSHQDIGWENAPDVCARNRAEKIMLPLLQRMAENEQYCFSVESALYLQEFLDLYPEKQEEVARYTREGRLDWGATYTQPYVGFYEGEALIRQTYLGRKWLKKRFPGCDFKSAWNVDVPGMTMQFPQILKKSGIPYYQISRFKKGFYDWKSPDGSSVIVVSTGQYSDYSGRILGAETESARTDTLIGLLNFWGDYHKRRNISPECLALLSQDCSTPVNYDVYIKDWNEKVKHTEYKNFPVLKYSTATSFMDALVANKKAAFDPVEGERPNVWLYIHGPTHHKAVAASREACRSLTAAEKFSTFEAWLDNSYANYPEARLQDAWKNAIYADHGWGGNQGVITDRLFRQKFEKARDTANDVAQEAMQRITRKINYNTNHLYAATVFNPLSWERTDPVIFSLDVEGRMHNRLKVVDEQGQDVPFQLTQNPKESVSCDEVLTFCFVAEKIPSLGYKTYYIVETEQVQTVSSTPDLPDYENQFYRMRLGNGGIQSLFDKELKSEVFETKRFKGGELFTMRSVGTGAGEFSEIQQPSLEDFDKLSNYQTPWTCVESGAVRDIFQTAVRFSDTQATIRISMYKTLKRIDYEIDLNGYVGKNWREYRLAFPMKQKQSKIAYECPMGVMEVGKGEMQGNAGDETIRPAYNVPSKSIHPREVQDWFSASDGEQTLTVGSDVAVFDWLDPTDSTNLSPILQPVLLSSRKSCHGLGNYYLQAGTHHYRFSLYSHAGDWKNGYQAGAQSNQFLGIVVTSRDSMGKGELAPALSFASVEGTDVIVSAVKKCEDDESVIVRCYNIGEKDVTPHFQFFRDIQHVEHTNLIEEEGRIIKSATTGFQFPLGHQSIETFKIHTK